MIVTDRPSSLTDPPVEPPLRPVCGRILQRRRRRPVDVRSIDGGPGWAYPHQNVDNEWTMREIGHQAVVWQGTGVLGPEASPHTRSWNSWRNTGYLT